MKENVRFPHKILRLRSIVQRRKICCLSLGCKRLISVNEESLFQGKEQICNGLKGSTKSTSRGLVQRPYPNQNSQLKICTAGVGEEEAQRSQLNRWCLTSMSRTPSLRGCEGCFLAGNSQSGLRLKANWDNIRNSHLIWTQPGLQIKLHGWYLLEYYDNSMQFIVKKQYKVQIVV